MIYIVFVVAVPCLSGASKWLVFQLHFFQMQSLMLQFHLLKFLLSNRIGQQWERLIPENGVTCSNQGAQLLKKYKNIKSTFSITRRI